MDMINLDDIKPGKLLVGKTAVVRRRVFQIISPLQELKTRFNIDVIGENYYLNNSKYRFWRRQSIGIMKEDLLKSNNYLPWFKKPRINEIFDWYILRFENEMYTQEQNP